MGTSGSSYTRRQLSKVDGWMVWDTSTLIRMEPRRHPTMSSSTTWETSWQTPWGHYLPPSDKRWDGLTFKRQQQKWWHAGWPRPCNASQHFFFFSFFFVHYHSRQLLDTSATAINLQAAALIWCLAIAKVNLHTRSQPRLAVSHSKGKHYHLVAKLSTAFHVPWFSKWRKVVGSETQIPPVSRKEI